MGSKPLSLARDLYPSTAGSRGVFIHNSRGPYPARTAAVGHLGCDGPTSRRLSLSGSLTSSDGRAGGISFSYGDLLAHSRRCGPPLRETAGVLESPDPW